MVCALLHDIGDTLGPRITRMSRPPSSSPSFGGESLDRRASRIFQGYYFFHFLGLDRDMREKFRGHPHFEKTEEFCRLFDQVAFDPNFKSMPLDAFEPMLQRVFCQPRRSFYRAEAAE